MATSQNRELEEPLSSAPAGTGRKLHAFAHFLGQNIVTWLLSRRKAHWEMQSSKGPRALPKVVLMPAEVGRKDTDDIEQFLLQLYLFIFFGGGQGSCFDAPTKAGLGSHRVVSGKCLHPSEPLLSHVRSRFMISESSAGQERWSEGS